MSTTSIRFTLRCNPPLSTKAKRRMLWELKAAAAAHRDLPWRIEGLAVDAIVRARKVHSPATLWNGTLLLLRQAGIIDGTVPSRATYRIMPGPLARQDVTLSVRR